MLTAKSVANTTAFTVGTRALPATQMFFNSQLRKLNVTYMKWKCAGETSN